MEQRRIMEILLQMTDPAARGHRLNQLLVSLTNEIYESDDDSPEDFGWHEGLRALLGRLVFGSLDHFPPWLPVLFPAFAYACGPRDPGMRSAEIDWTIAMARIPSPDRFVVADPARLQNPADSQAHILKLLLEAAGPTSSWESRNAILDELSGMAYQGDGTSEGFGRSQAGTGLLCQVFHQGLDHSPGSLPFLFPIFAALGGSRKEGVLLVDPDWSLAGIS